MKNYGDLGGCYPPRPKASTNNTLLDLHNNILHKILSLIHYLLIINPTISRFASRLLRLSHNSTITPNDIIIIFHDQNEHHNFNDITLV